MTRDEIISMAREVGMQGMLTDVVTTFDELERFAALVAEKEREECAMVCEHLANAVSNENHIAIEQRQFCAKVIRARGD